MLARSFYCVPRSRTPRSCTHPRAETLEVQVVLCRIESTVSAHVNTERHTRKASIVHVTCVMDGARVSVV